MSAKIEPNPEDYRERAKGMLREYLKKSNPKKKKIEKIEKLVSQLQLAGKSKKYYKKAFDELDELFAKCKFSGKAVTRINGAVRKARSRRTKGSESDSKNTTIHVSCENKKLIDALMSKKVIRGKRKPKSANELISFLLKSYNSSI